MEATVVKKLDALQMCIIAFELENDEILGIDIDHSPLDWTGPAIHYYRPAFDLMIDREDIEPTEQGQYRYVVAVNHDYPDLPEVLIHCSSRIPGSPRPKPTEKQLSEYDERPTHRDENWPEGHLDPLEAPGHRLDGPDRETCEYALGERPTATETVAELYLRGDDERRSSSEILADNEGEL